jgi:hypothetical protein
MTTNTFDPGVDVNIIDSSIAALNGVSMGTTGFVGSASFGPVGVPTTAGSYAQGAAIFGDLTTRKHDLMTQVATASVNGCSDMRLIRATDNTDTKAIGNVTVSVANTPVIIASVAAKWTGSLGNQIGLTLASGAKSNSITVSVTVPNQTTEIFDNLPNVGFANAFVAAVATGAGVARGPSNFITAAIGNTSVTPAAATLTLAGGSDGATGVTAAMLVGSDSTVKTGMYALREQGVRFLVLSDADDSSTWTLQSAFAQAEYMLAGIVDPAGDTIANAIATKDVAGLDNPWAVELQGDWPSFNDTINGVVRKVSPQGFWVGIRSNLLPHESAANKEVSGIVTSERIASGSAYSSAERNQLFQNGIDVITNPANGGNYWALRGGYNTSSNLLWNSDSWTTMTNYLSATLKAGLGIYDGQVINQDTMNAAKATVTNFLGSLVDRGILAKVNGKMPFSVVCDSSNNSQADQALGYMTMDVKVQYQGIIRQLVLNLEAGAGVTITPQN